MRRLRRNLPAIGLAALLAACLAAAYWSRDAGSAPAPSKPATAAVPRIDDRLLATAQRVSAIAETPDQQAFAREALRLSDHEFDQAFASASREASKAAAHATNGPFKDLIARIAQLKTRIAAEQAQIDKLSKQSESSDAAAGRLELIQAQLALDQDALDEARQDLARRGGDPQAELERAMQQHEAAQHNTPQSVKPASIGPTDTMALQIGAWMALTGRDRDIETARKQAADRVSALTRERNALEKLIAGQQVPIPPAEAESVDQDSSDDDTADEDTETMVARLRQLSDQRKTLSELDKRIEDAQSLENVYARWSASIDGRREGILHLLFLSLSIVFAILLAVALAHGVIRRAFGRQKDPRRLRQLRTMAIVALQVVAALLILLVIFGPPTQLSAIVGLATAGLTVAMKDFIVAFFGWFALMGKNGIRLGDWVEIEGVGGEVIEIGLLKTVLLEMGNWTNTGHPTGRRVAFVNKFAIENHYFNFSTAGQWLWDELQVTVPASGDPYGIARQIGEVVERETAADAGEAQAEWERVTRQYGTKPFSAKPGVDLRPSVNGLDVVVRYITRAPQRFEVKSRLFQAIVDLLHRNAAAPASVAP